MGKACAQVQLWWKVKWHEVETDIKQQLKKRATCTRNVENPLYNSKKVEVSVPELELKAANCKMLNLALNLMS